jgi:hypothetical protein
MKTFQHVTTHSVKYVTLTIKNCGCVVTYTDLDIDLSVVM